MATDGKKLNQLPELTTLSDATMFYAVNGGEDYHVNFETIKDEAVPEVFTPTTDGLVPHPNSGNGGKVLRGDGTWQGTFDSLNDGLVPKLGTNDKDNVLRGDGAWVTNDKLIGTGSGSLVTFDAIEAPMPSLKASIKAKQDLHGYDKPWVGGVGKNKYNKNNTNNQPNKRVSTGSGGTYTADGYTATYLVEVKPNTDYTLTTSSNFVSYICWYDETQTRISGTNWSSGTSKTSPSNAKYIRFDFSTADIDTVQLEQGSTATSFEPYENICPISGWDAANMSDNDGGNLYGGTFNTLFPLFIPKQTRITASALGQTTLALYDAQKNKIDDWGLYDVDEATGRNYRSLIFNYDVYYVSFIYREASDVQIKKGFDITYSAYNGVTITISLPQTVYGGELDVVNGVLTITDGYIASYNGETLPSTWISSMDEYAVGTTPTTGAEVCYELATPTTVSITPSLIKSLNGTNNLSVDCGEILEVEYQRSITEAINVLEAGGGYSETSLWSNSSGVYTGSLALSDSIENYNALMFKVSNAQGWANFAFVPTSALASNNAKAGIGGGMQSAVWWFQFTRTDATHITINNNSSTNDKLYQIVGVKY